MNWVKDMLFQSPLHNSFVSHLKYIITIPIQKRTLSRNASAVKPEQENVVNSQFHQNLIPVITSEETTSLPVTLEKDVPASEKESVKLRKAVKPTGLDFRKQVTNIRLLIRYYISLSKFDQIGAAILTALHGYGMAPGPFDSLTFTCMVIGTALSTAGVFAVNQVLEIPYDAQMNRTKNRPLIRGDLTPLHASTFAACCASIGLATLYLGTNTLATSIAAAGMIIYVCIYTPMKRYSIANTWVSSVVDGMVPVIGWTACTGNISADAVLIGIIVYSWQFPRFNALSWTLREDYSRAGYRVTSVIDPAMCRRVAFRHSVGLLVLCSCAPLLDLTTWTFALDSFPLNCCLIYSAWKFYKDGDDESAGKLFRFSLFYLPVLMFLMLVGKK